MRTRQSQMPGMHTSNKEEQKCMLRLLTSMPTNPLPYFSGSTNTGQDTPEIQSILQLRENFSVTVSQ